MQADYNDFFFLNLGVPTSFKIVLIYVIIWQFLSHTTKESRCTISGWLNPFDMKSRTKRSFRSSYSQIPDLDTGFRCWFHLILPKIPKPQATSLCPFSQISLLRVVGLLKYMLFLSTQSSYFIILFNLNFKFFQPLCF